MKIKVEIDENYIEDEVIIKCAKITPEVMRIQEFLASRNSQNFVIELFKENVEYYEDVKNIIFFETDGDTVRAHTREDIFTIKKRLYELEDILPYYFCRISKSSILNAKEIYSITKNITASSKIEFKDTHKHVYVSRGYFKPLKNKIEEIRSL